MNPFDPKSVLLAKHAQHVVLVHFPIALFLTGVAFDFGAQLTRKAALATAAYFNLVAAAVSVVPVLATGIVAWQWQLAGQRLKGLLLLHLALGVVSGALICLVAWIRLRSGHDPGSELSRPRLGLELLTAVLVAVTAHVGGFVSGITTFA